MISQICIICLVALIPFTGNAERSGWMTGYEARKIPGISKKLIIAIDCRDTNKPGLLVGKLESNVTYSDNPSKKKFYWAVGSEFGRYKIKAKKKGYKLVSFKQFTRKASGLKIRCGVWHGH